LKFLLLCADENLVSRHLLPVCSYIHQGKLSDTGLLRVVRRIPGKQDLFARTLEDRWSGCCGKQGLVFPPPLRQRKEDIPLLVQAFVERCSRKLGKQITSIQKKTMKTLQDYPWPGNVRELESVLERP